MTTDNLSYVLTPSALRVGGYDGRYGNGCGLIGGGGFGYGFDGGGGQDKGSGTGDGWSHPSRHYQVPERIIKEALP